MIVTGLLLAAAANAPDEFYDNMYYSAAEKVEVFYERARNYQPTEVHMNTTENDTGNDNDQN